MENENFGKYRSKQNSLTPLMKQYWDIKVLHPDKILLFRMGDFFEMFFEDAQQAAPLLGIALTSRNKKSQDETPMCGVPHHSIAGPINKLLAQGLKIAICDQIEDPKFAKGLVKRAVTRILTPGMVYDSDTLSPSQSHYIASIDEVSLSCVDTTTGESFYFLEKTVALQWGRLFSILPIAEMVVTEGFILPTELEKLTKDKKILLTEIKMDLKSLDIFTQMGEPVSSYLLLQYISSLGGSELLKILRPFEERTFQNRMYLSASSIRHLELFTNNRGESSDSLFSIINHTQTASGARLLRNWMSFPLTDIDSINKRLDRVEFWRHGSSLETLKKVRDTLSKMGDIERRLNKLSQPQCHGRDLLSLAQSIRFGVQALSLYSSKDCGTNGLKKDVLETKDSLNLQALILIADDVLNTFVEDPPLQVRSGYMIRKGVHSGLDEWISLSMDSQSLIQKMENEEKEKTQISSLKIRYNNVFGYYIEITHIHKDKVPPHYKRKQTLANAERFFTDELIELERKVLSAQTRRSELEYEIFNQMREKIIAQAPQLLLLAQACSRLDVETCLAWVSLKYNYMRPILGSSKLKLISSRHPVVEQTVDNSFVPNSLELSKGGALLLTGPNMAGKSTLMRQVALISILAQMGSFIPADQSELPIFDQIFTRIGASDQLSEGLSTFMVEMSETSEMLHQATSRSLLILDEVGRGTSTYDGMSLAQSILEYILNSVGAMTLFATHYHEITKLSSYYSELQNAHMTVKESGGEIRFLHTLASGPALRSYGIHVAKLAGLPEVVTSQAQKILAQLEHPNHEKNQFIGSPGTYSGGTYLPGTYSTHQIPGAQELTPHLPGIKAAKNGNDYNKHQLIIDDIKQFSLSQMTPLEALIKISHWQKQISNATLIQHENEDVSEFNHLL